jgi:hypothetical protein
MIRSEGWSAPNLLVAMIDMTVPTTPYALASLKKHEGNLTHAETIQFSLDDWFVAHRYKAWVEKGEFDV